jgi:AMP phosphorylase
MKFQVKILPLRTEKFSVILNQSDADELGLLPGDRVKISIGKESFIAEVEVATEMIEEGQAGVCSYTAETCEIEEECQAEITPVPKPKSVEFIRKKLDGFKYTRSEVYSIISDISNNILTDVEMTAFIIANEVLGMDYGEIQWMIEAMVENGERAIFERGVVVDVHSIGGVPGGKASILAVPTIAAAGLLIPKTASRAITSASGTADTMEVLANVNLSVDEIKEITERVGGVIAWSAGANIAPADDKIIRVEHQLEISPKPHMIASLLSKKLAMDVSYVAIDIPVGEGAKIESVDLGRRYANDFVELGSRLNLKVGVTLTDGSQPIGRSVGPALEAKEALKAMEEKKRPRSLIEKSLGIAGLIFEMAGVATNGYEYAKKIFESGKTLEKFKEIVEAQGGEAVKADDIPVGDKTFTLISTSEGFVRQIDVRAINEIARAAGAPKDKGAGVYVHKKRGEVVKAGDPLITIYAEKEWKLDNAVEIANRRQAIAVSGLIIEKYPFGRW